MTLVHLLRGRLPLKCVRNLWVANGAWHEPSTCGILYAFMLTGDKPAVPISGLSAGTHVAVRGVFGMCPETLRARGDLRGATYDSSLAWLIEASLWR